MRVAPLVMTRKFTVTRIVNTMMPITKSPLMTKREKPPMIWPAAVGPSDPCVRMRRVEAMFSASRNIVAMSSTVGKAEKSSGLSIHSPTIRIRTESAIERASP